MKVQKNSKKFVHTNGHYNMKTIINEQGCYTVPGPNGLHLSGEFIVDGIDVAKNIRELVAINKRQDEELKATKELNKQQDAELRKIKEVNVKQENALNNYAQQFVLLETQIKELQKTIKSLAPQKTIKDLKTNAQAT